MRVEWTTKASSGVVRLHAFLASVNAAAASHLVKSLVTAPDGLLLSPRIGERLEEFHPREIRKLLIGRYEMRYEIVGSAIYIMRVWHTREEH